MTKNEPAFCPGCGAATMTSVGIGTYCPSVLCDRGDDLRPVGEANAFLAMPEDEPSEFVRPVGEANAFLAMPEDEPSEFVTIPAPELEKLQDDLANALELVRKLQRDNGKLQFMLLGESVAGCGTCPRSGSPNVG